jgi:glutaredoxin
MNDIYTVIIKVGCPYCEKAVSVLQKKGKKHYVVDYFKLSKQYKEYLSEVIKEMNNGNDHSTYPKVFKNDKFVGGCEQLLSLLRTI